MVITHTHTPNPSSIGFATMGEGNSFEKKGAQGA
jgi:hypothetical protein